MKASSVHSSTVMLHLQGTVYRLLVLVEFPCCCCVVIVLQYCVGVQMDAVTKVLGGRQKLDAVTKVLGGRQKLTFLAVIRVIDIQYPCGCDNLLPL